MTAQMASAHGSWSRRSHRGCLEGQSQLACNARISPFDRPSKSSRSSSSGSGTFSTTADGAFTTGVEALVGRPPPGATCSSLDSRTSSIQDEHRVKLDHQSHESTVEQGTGETVGWLYLGFDNRGNHRLRYQYFCLAEPSRERATQALASLRSMERTMQGCKKAVLGPEHVRKSLPITSHPAVMLAISLSRRSFGRPSGVICLPTACHATCPTNQTFDDFVGHSPVRCSFLRSAFTSRDWVRANKRMRTTRLASTGYSLPSLGSPIKQPVEQIPWLIRRIIDSSRTSFSTPFFHTVVAIVCGAGVQQRPPMDTI